MLEAIYIAIAVCVTTAPCGSIMYIPNSDDTRFETLDACHKAVAKMDVGDGMKWLCVNPLRLGE